MSSILYLLLPALVLLTAMTMSNLSSAPFNAAFHYEVRREINAPIEKVWSVLTDLQSYPEW